jgi:hypothetical protein
MTFESTKVKLKIGTLDEGKKLQVEAQYNPKELEISKTIPWTPHAKGNEDGLQMEFTGGQAREITLELLFDGYETDGMAGSVTVTEAVKTLNEMASVRVAGSKKDEERRPYHCCVVWGKLIGEKAFPCVITSVKTKYTMFKADGTPLRATCTVALKEASRAMMAEKPKGSAK